MQKISYLIVLYLTTALVTGCGPNEIAPPDILAADKESGADDEENDKKPAKDPAIPEEVIEIYPKDPPFPVAVVQPLPLPLPYPGLGGLYGGGGGGRRPISSLLIEKTASVESLVAGELITFSFTITNNGATEVSSVEVEEIAFSGLGLTSPISCLPVQPAILASGAQMVCTATYTVQQGDVDSGELTNSVRVTGIGPRNIPLTDTDSLVLPAFIDFGDAPNTYGTLFASDGARHSVPGYSSLTNLAPLRLGATIDIENDGIPNAAADGDDEDNIDDENGLVDLSNNVISSINVIGAVATQVSISVTNATSSAATLAGWIDFNDNGVFEAGERQTLAILANSGTQTYGLTFPATAVSSGDSYARFRLFPGTVVAPSSTGPAAGGEVEDYPVLLDGGLDFADAPDSYGTLLASDGARHQALSYNAVANTSSLSLGLLIDTEADGFPGVATGDDLDNINDEAGVVSPIIVASGLATTVIVSVSNTTALVATLAGWIDLNSNNTFDVGELITAAIPASSGTANYNLVFPATTVGTGTTYARFRLYSGVVAAPSPLGFASSGEVEDYTVVTSGIIP